MEKETLSEKREEEFKLLKDRISSLQFKDRFVVEDWINQLYRELERQDKQFIKEILEKIDKFLLDYEEIEEHRTHINSEYDIREEWEIGDWTDNLKQTIKERVGKELLK